MPMNKTFGFQDINVAIRGLTSGASAGTAKTVGLGTTSTANAPSHPRISATESKWYDGAAYFDGTGDYLTTSASGSDFTVGGGPFTIECYAYFNSFSGSPVIFSAGTGGVSALVNSSGYLTLYRNGGGGYSSSLSTNPLSLKRWYHLVWVTNNGSQWYGYIDGFLAGAFASGWSGEGTTSPGYVSTYGNGVGTQVVNGYLQDLKIYKGFAKYTEEFTPPQPICGFTTDISTQTGFTTTTATGALLSSVVGLGSTSTLAFDADTTYAGITSITSSSGITTLTDPYAQNLVLALPLADITGVGNSFTNDRNTQIRSVSLVSGGTTKTITNTNVSLATTSKSYSTGSSFSGSGVQLTATNSSDFDIKSGDYTIEFWFYSNTTSGTQSIVTRGSYSGTPSTPGFGLHQTEAKISLYYGTSEFFTSNFITTGRWYHFALVQQSGVQRMYVDGVFNVSGTLTLSADSSTNMDIGHSNTVWGVNYPFNGYLQDLRIYKGVAKYTTNFTPPPPMFGDYTRSTPNKIIFTPASDYVLEAKNTSGILTSSYSATRQWGTKPEGGIYDPYAGNLRLAYPFNNTTTFYDTTGQIKLETPTSSYSSGQVVTSPSGSTHTNQTVTNPSSAVTFVNTQSKFYGYSAFFDSSTDEIVAQDASLSWGTNDLTIEWWSYRNAETGTYRTIWDSREGGNVLDTNGTYITFNANSIAGFVPSNMGTDEPINQWNHYAICRKSGILYAFVNGVPRGTPTANTNNYSNTTARIGNSIDNYNWTGYIQDFRLYIGLAKYQVGVSFTPPNQIYLT
jgi:hypothetical protein